MTSIIKSIDINVPVRTAYDQWTQFESFPEFMEGVEEVRQVDDQDMHLADQHRWTQGGVRRGRHGADSRRTCCLAQHDRQDQRRRRNVSSSGRGSRPA